MRIIAGSAHSLPLKSLPGEETRPTTDRIKETLFNIIQNDVPGAVFLDLFAGSGSIGLEAISRGAKKAVFVESSRKAAACIRDNISFTKFDSSCELLVTDAVSAVGKLYGREVFDIIFMDPPYGKDLELEVSDALAGSDILTGDTVIIIEASKNTDISAYERNGAFLILRDKQYKTNRHVFLKLLN